MHSDLYATVDLLNYEIYASILARLITSGLSKPPFNISIIAPWGKGKTTLMRFIQNKINSKALLSTIKEHPVSSIPTLLSWIRGPGDLFTDFKKLEYPVVWFNAWKFQKSEQVWAGLADEIIKQLVTQLDRVDQEKFWLKLNLKRVDRDKLKRELVFKLLQKFLIPFLYIALGTTIFLAFNYINWNVFLNGSILKAIWAFKSIPLVAGISAAVIKIRPDLKKPPEFDVDAGTGDQIKFILKIPER